MASAPPDPNTILGGAAEMLLPATQPLSDMSEAAPPADPIMALGETGKALWEVHKAEYQQAQQALSEGRYSEAIGHGVAAAFPLYGPLAAAAGQHLASGEYARATGNIAGLLLPLAIGRVTATVAKVAKEMPPSLEAQRASFAERYPAVEPVNPAEAAAGQAFHEILGGKSVAEAEKLLANLPDDLRSEAAQRLAARLGGKNYLEKLGEVYGHEGPEGVTVYRDPEGASYPPRDVVVQRSDNKVVGGGTGYAGYRLMVAGGRAMESPVSISPVYAKLDELGYLPSDVLSYYGAAAVEKGPPVATLR